MRRVISLLLLLPLVATAQSYAGLPCVSNKATLGDKLSVGDPTVLERTVRYAPPRMNRDGFYQELLMQVSTDKDAVRKAANDKATTWILIHGGGFRGGTLFDPDFGHVATKVLVPRGYDAASIEYRTGWVVCDVDTPTQADFCGSDSLDFLAAVEFAVRDAKDAVRYLKRNAAALGIADSFYIAGTSAGGSLAAYLTVLDQGFADSMGIHGGYLGFGGYRFQRIEKTDGAYVLSHNPGDPIAPWETGRLFLCPDMPRNIGFRAMYDSLVAASSQVAFWAACKGGHGLQLAQNFGQYPQWDTLFVGQNGMLTDFLPKAWAGTYGQQRITYPSGTSDFPVIGGTCPCEPSCP